MPWTDDEVLQLMIKTNQAIKDVSTAVQLQMSILSSLFRLVAFTVEQSESFSICSKN
jgi:hypothetical protein